MKELNEFLDVRRRLIFLECLVKFLDPATFPECQRYRLPILRRNLKDDLDLLKSEIEAWVAVEAVR